MLSAGVPGPEATDLLLPIAVPLAIDGHVRRLCEPIQALEQGSFCLCCTTNYSAAYCLFTTSRSSSGATLLSKCANGILVEYRPTASSGAYGGASTL